MVVPRLSPSFTSSFTVSGAGSLTEPLARIKVDETKQNKETSTALGSAAWLWELWRQKHGNAWLLSRRQAAFHGLVLMVPQMFSGLQADHAAKLQDSANFQLGGPEKLTSAPRPAARVAENGGLADLC